METIGLLTKLDNDFLRIDGVVEVIDYGCCVKFSFGGPLHDLAGAHDAVASAWPRTRARKRARTDLVLVPCLAETLRSDWIIIFSNEMAFWVPS